MTNFVFQRAKSHWRVCLSYNLLTDNAQIFVRIINNSILKANGVSGTALSISQTSSQRILMVALRKMWKS